MVYNDVFDVCLVNIELWKDGLLELGFDYVKVYIKDDVYFVNDNVVKKGYMGIVEYI